MLNVVLTGHSRGLGAALCTALLARGARVLALSRHLETSPPTSPPGTPAALTGVALDLADSAALTAWLAGGALSEHLAGPAPALLINNAGSVTPMGDDRTLDPAAIAQTVALNCAAPLMLSAAFLAATQQSRDRRILHVSSGAARTPYAGWSTYCATKAALDQHARALQAAHVARLRIESLAPGVIDTAMQGTIRASDPTGFPRHARFLALHADGQLQDAAATAAQILDHLLSEGFGQSPLTDLRTL